MAAKKKIAAKPSDEHLRAAALGHAIEHGRHLGLLDSQVLSAAAAFLAFLKGEEQKS